ncbi:MAG: hypothetical protein GY929_04785 [Actinomycetia bacterium]|nr:hypothetical protein [Actinomycetes bacterium]
MWITVDDIDAAVDKVRALGGTADDPVVYDSGASADCVDDPGTRFCVSVPAEEYRSEPASGTRPGELFYWSLPVAAKEADRTCSSGSRMWWPPRLGWSSSVGRPRT